MENRGDEGYIGGLFRIALIEFEFEFEESSLPNSSLRSFNDCFPLEDVIIIERCGIDA